MTKYHYLNIFIFQEIILYLSIMPRQLLKKKLFKLLCYIDKQEMRRKYQS